MLKRRNKRKRKRKRKGKEKKRKERKRKENKARRKQKMQLQAIHNNKIVLADLAGVPTYVLTTPHTASILGVHLDILTVLYSHVLHCTGL